MARPIPEKIHKARMGWWRAYVVWITIHWMLTATAIITASLAAAFIDQAKIFGVIAAASSALIGTANPYKRATGFECAHRKLNNGCIAFECNESFSIQDLIKAHDEGEVIIEASES